MKRPGRVGWLGAALVACAACGGSTPEEFATANVIPDCVPVGAPLSVGETMEYMAGRYRVVMVRDGSKEQAFGVVDMERAPEAYRDWGAATATLTGSAQIDLGAVGAQTLSGLDSTDPARPGLGSKTAMQPLNMKPSPSVMTPDGMPSEWVMVTQTPFLSTTATCVVSAGSGWPNLSTCIRSPPRMRSASPAA